MNKEELLQKATPLKEEILNYLNDRLNKTKSLELEYVAQHAAVCIHLAQVSYETDTSFDETVMVLNIAFERLAAAVRGMAVVRVKGGST